MNAQERRSLLMEKLKAADQPLTGVSLAGMLGVSRQIVVGDIAILRASGHIIYATPQGYTIPPVSTAAIEIIACCHDGSLLEQELAIVIENGGKVNNVIVEHAVYGEIKANLMIGSRRDLNEFLANLAKSSASPLSVVTNGIHLHTIEAPNEAILRDIKQQLKDEGILLS